MVLWQFKCRHSFSLYFLLSHNFKKHSARWHEFIHEWFFWECLVITPRGIIGIAYKPFIYDKDNWTWSTSVKISPYGRSYTIPLLAWNLWWQYSSERIIFMTSRSSVAFYYELFSWLKIQHSVDNGPRTLACVCSMWVFSKYYWW